MWCIVSYNLNCSICIHYNWATFKEPFHRFKSSLNAFFKTFWRTKKRYSCSERSSHWTHENALHKRDNKTIFHFEVRAAPPKVIKIVLHQDFLCWMKSHTSSKRSLPRQILQSVLDRKFEACQNRFIYRVSINSRFEMFISQLQRVHIYWP